MTTEATMAERLDAIGQIAHPVSDLDRSIAFFQDLLGLRLLFRAPPSLAFLDCGGVRLMLDHLAFQAGSRQASALYFKVKDIDSAAQRLQQRGLQFETPPHRVARLPDHDLWMAFFRDPDQHLLALMSEVRPPAAS